MRGRGEENPPEGRDEVREKGEDEYLKGKRTHPSSGVEGEGGKGRFNFADSPGPFHHKELDGGGGRGRAINWPRRPPAEWPMDSAAEGEVPLSGERENPQMSLCRKGEGGGGGRKDVDPTDVKKSGEEGTGEERRKGEEKED